MLEGGYSSFINYSKLVDEAMREIAKKILKQIESEGLKRDHYFLITFLTSQKDVRMSKRLLERYPEEMTIILQHQFDSLAVSDSYFEVSLSFDGIKENITVPFSAFTAIVDPSTKFALQFNTKLVEDDSEDDEVLSQVADTKPKSPKTSNKSHKQEKVISLDKFRNQKN